ncbi:MAG TPA: hypothetical protein VGR74_01655 [Actinomycetota bacterium]|nr:hypothetical protein [Actinomycetota bacterium]
MNPSIVVEYLARTEGLTKGLQEIGSSGSKAQALAKKAFLPAAAALGAIGVAALKTVDAASALNEQINGSTVIFGASSKAVVEWSKTLAESAGLSATAGLTAANQFGAMFKTLGLGAPTTAKMSQQMVQLAGDLASFKDIAPEEALEKLRAGLTGEAEPLRAVGVFLTEAAVQQEAYRLGLAKTGAKLTEQQKIQARYSLILQQTKDAQGDFARTSDSVANSQRTAAAQTANMSAQFGQALLPVTKAVLSVLKIVLTFMGRYPGVLKIVVAAVAALAAAIVVLNVALTIAAVVTSAWILPVLAVIAAVVALIAVGVLLWKNWDKITAALRAAWAGIQNAASSAVQQVTAAFGRLVAGIMGLVSRLLSWLRANWQTILLILGGPVGAAVVLIARYWTQISSAAQRAWAAVRSTIASFLSWFGGAVSRISSLASSVGSALHAIGSAATTAKDAVVRALDGILSKLRSILGKVQSAASAVGNAIRSPLNAVISSFNGISFTIPGFTIGGQKVGPLSVPKVSVPSHRIDFPDIPHLAGGGVLTSPTLFLGGEAGREIVAPERLLRQLLAEERGGTYQLYLQPRTADAGDVAYAFRRLELLRTGR